MADATVSMKLSKAELVIILAALIHRKPGLFTEEGEIHLTSLRRKMGAAVAEILQTPLQ
jgi:hypothetical protein